MPVYTFECEKCKKKMDKIQKFDESNPVCNCIEKGVSMNRLMPMTGKPKFSGSGFYETDYKQKTNKPVSGGKEKNE